MDSRLRRGNCVHPQHREEESAKGGYWMSFKPLPFKSLATRPGTADPFSSL